ncbi:uncharacterized protein LOC105684489 isoform X1 [Athalia rosae]|uniref:uncharacterized protein LOC105684489 isoform X1 n=1 Tax=Athalia rosae TaxID=37344 RepID=UPI0020347ADB|nr:uncharacterized protein LOC105684489 isoform X1 [Athalia rosae]
MNYSMEKVQAIQRKSTRDISKHCLPGSSVQQSFNDTNHHTKHAISQCNHLQQVDYKTDSAVAQDLGCQKDFKQSSIILAGNSPRESQFHRSVDSFYDSRHSTILAGQLDCKNVSKGTKNVTIRIKKATTELDSNSKKITEITLDSDCEDITGYSEKATNESVGNNRRIKNTMRDSDDRNIENQSQDVESSCYADSLEVQREVSLKSETEQDSSEVKNCYMSGKSLQISPHSNNKGLQNVFFSKVEKQHHDALDNPNVGQISRFPRVRCIEKVNFPLQNFKIRSREHQSRLDTISKDKNDNIQQKSNNSEETKNNFSNSCMNESEQLIMASVRTPNLKTIEFIEDCCKSSPLVGEYADTFESKIISNISEPYLDELCNPEIEQNTTYDEINCTNKVLKRLSEQFAEAPKKFTERLLTLFEESMLQSSFDKPSISDVSLNRLTEEFRKICIEHCKPIGDETMPDFGVSQLQSSLQIDKSSTNHTSQSTNTIYKGMTPSLQNFTKLGGGKKIYRKTPRKIFESNSTHFVSSPNLHKTQNNESPSFRHVVANSKYDSTATFELLEDLCYAMSPTKQSKCKSPYVEKACRASYEDLVRKSDGQMASLADSIILNDENEDFASKNKEASMILLDCGNDDKEFIRNLISPLVIKSKAQKGKGLQKSDSCYNEAHEEAFEELLTARLVEKRRKCFEAANRGCDTQTGPIVSESSRSLQQSSRVIDEREITNTPGYGAAFFSTLSACIDYFDDIRILRNHINSLSCISECSEESESMKKSMIDSKSLQSVEAFFLPKDNLTQSPTRKAFSHARTALLETNNTSLTSSKQEPVESFLNSNVSQTPFAINNTLNTSSGQVLAASKHHILTDRRSKVDSPNYKDIMNSNLRENTPAIIVTTDSPHKWNQLNFQDENMKIDCNRKLEVSDTETPKSKNKQKYFYTPGKTPTTEKMKPQKRYFFTPTETNSLKSSPMTFRTASGFYRTNYTNVQSPVAMYIKGTNPDLIKNVKGKTNERMLTPRSPILARSPNWSPTSAESRRLKFRLTPTSKREQEPPTDILNIAMCESGPLLNIDSECMSNSSFPKIFYKPAPSVKLIEDGSATPRKQTPKSRVHGTDNKIIYRHEGRVKSAKKTKEPSDASSKTDDLTVDVSLLREKPAVKSNHLSQR